MTERLRILERALSADPQNLSFIRLLADERKRRGLELLPAKVREDPWAWLPAFVNTAVWSRGEPDLRLTPEGWLEAYWNWNYVSMYVRTRAAYGLALPYSVIQIQ